MIRRILMSRVRQRGEYAGVGEGESKLAEVRGRTALDSAVASSIIIGCYGAATGCDIARDETVAATGVGSRDLDSAALAAPAI
jgi:hypothetical protein